MLAPRRVVIYAYIPMMVIDLIIFIKLLSRMYCQRDDLRPKSFQISAFQSRAHCICFCCILLTSACDMGHALGAEFTDTSLITEIRWISILVMAADAFYFTSSLLIYSILINRLYSTFDNTIYEIPRSTLIFASFIISVQCLLMTAYTLDVGFNYNGSSNDSKWIHVGGVLSACILTVDAVLNVFLFALFIRKLRQSVMMRLQTDSESMTVSDALSQKSSTKVVDVLTKQTLIGISVTFCSAGFTMTSFVTEAFGRETQWDYMMDYVVRAVEGALIAFLLYLGLYINDAEYLKVCGRCHRFARDYRVHKMEKEISDGYYPMQDFEDSS